MGVTLSDMKGYVSKEVFNGTWEKPNYTQGYEQTWNNKKKIKVFGTGMSLYCQEPFAIQI